MEAHHHGDVTFHEDTATSRIGSGPANPATIRAALKDADYLHIPEGPTRPHHPRRNPPPPPLRLRQKRTLGSPEPCGVSAHRVDRLPTGRRGLLT
jgi:hypothetical protein